MTVTDDGSSGADMARDAKANRVFYLPFAYLYVTIFGSKGEQTMTLELHDNEAGKTLRAKIFRLDFDYQAEQWVQDTSRDDPEVIKWILIDDDGTRCVWERPVGSTDFPEITQRSARFTGEWKRGPAEVAI